MTTNGAGDTVSTGTNCKWPSNMTARNAFRGPGAYNINLAIRKQFAVTERYKLQFSTEFYNLLNHSNYYVQGGGVNDFGNFFPSPDHLEVIGNAASILHWAFPTNDASSRWPCGCRSELDCRMKQGLLG